MKKFCTGKITMNPGVNGMEIGKIPNANFFVFSRSIPTIPYNEITVALPKTFLGNEFIIDQFKQLFVSLADQISLNGTIEIYQGGEEQVVQVTERIIQKNGKKINQRFVHVFERQVTTHKRLKTLPVIDQEEEQTNYKISTYESLMDLIVGSLNLDEGAYPLSPEFFEFISSTCINKTLIGSRRALKMILQAMKIHPNLPILQENVCELLEYFMSDVYSRVLIRNKEGIDSILIAMKTHPKCDGIRIRALKVLRCFDQDYKRQLLEWEKDEIELILQVMKSHPDHLDVQEWVFNALENSLQPPNFKPLTESKEIDSIVEIMELYPNHFEIQYYGCHVLERLVRYGIMFEAEKTIKVMLRAMKFHFNHVGYQEGACELLSLLSENDTNRISIEIKGGIQLLFRIFKYHSSKLMVQYEIEQALKTLAINQKNRKIINDLGFEV